MGSHTVINDPFAHFEAEHEEALRALSRMEDAVGTLERDGNSPAALADIRDVLHFLETAVRIHNENEEKTFFGLMGQDSPVQLFEQEHGELRVLEAEMTRALHGERPARDVPPVARNLIGLLRDHIERENQMLFPMARALLGEDGMATVARRLHAALGSRDA